MKFFKKSVKSMLLSILICILSNSISSGMPPLASMVTPDEPDYSKISGWLTKPAIPVHPADVFYVYPTVLFNDTDWVMDTKSPELIAAAKTQLDTQASVFQGQANIYAPMYRQTNLAVLSLPDKDGAPLKQLGHDDVWKALSYYLRHENNGRPFFLAGHSQGSMILTNLMLEHWGSTGAEDRLIAAFLIGWSLTPNDLKKNPEIVMCDNAAATGCVISYNTMAAGKQSVAPTRLNGALVVNPLSWTMAESFVSADNNLGAVFFSQSGQSVKYPHFTSAQIVECGLVVEPADIDLVTVKGGHFPSGVFHAFDYALFYENIRVNIKDRIKAFRK